VPALSCEPPLPFSCPGGLPAWRMLWIKSVRVSVPDISTRSGCAHPHIRASSLTAAILLGVRIS
jgi:hypothetical protein